MGLCVKFTHYNTDGTKTVYIIPVYRLDPEALAIMRVFDGAQGQFLQESHVGGFTADEIDRQYKLLATMIRGIDNVAGVDQRSVTDWGWGVASMNLRGEEPFLDQFVSYSEELPADCHVAEEIVYEENEFEYM